MFVGRECYKYTEILSQLLDKGTIRTRASPKWLQPWLKIYVYLFGVPDVGFQLRARYVRSIVTRFEFNRALDAGCGMGLNSLYLANKRPSATIDACDLHPGLVKAASIIRDNLKLRNVNIFQADLTQLSEVNKYDLICCIDVIEHIPDDSKVLLNFSRALKDGGILLVSTNHKRHINRRLKGLKYDSRGHVRGGYSESELSQLLETSGFDIKEIRNVWGFWGEYCEELYHWALLHLPVPLTALSFPLLSALSSLDMLAKNSSGYGLIAIAGKIKPEWSSRRIL